MAPGPMYLAGNARHIELPPVERTAINLKIQVRIFVPRQWYGSMHARDGRRQELIRLDSSRNVWTDRTRHRHRVAGAEAIRQKNFLSIEIHDDPIGLKELRTAPRLR